MSPPLSTFLCLTVPGIGRAHFPSVVQVAVCANVNQTAIAEGSLWDSRADKWKIELIEFGIKLALANDDRVPRQLWEAFNRPRPAINLPTAASHTCQWQSVLFYSPIVVVGISLTRADMHADTNWPKWPLAGLRCGIVLATRLCAVSSFATSVMALAQLGLPLCGRHVTMPSWRPQVRSLSRQ